MKYQIQQTVRVISEVEAPSREEAQRLTDAGIRFLPYPPHLVCYSKYSEVISALRTRVSGEGWKLTQRYSK